MVDLTTLLSSVHPTGTPPVKEFYVFNSNHWNCNNGGCCFQWTVPAKTTFIKFEIISGGGPGDNQSSSDWGTGGAGGNYAVKSLYASGTCIRGGSNYETRTGATDSGFTCNTCCTDLHIDLDTGGSWDPKDWNWDEGSVEINLYFTIG